MLQILDANASACITQRPHRAPHISVPSAHPMERAWAAGRPALSYPDRPAREPSLYELDPATMSLDDLVATQPKIRKGQSPFLPVETRGKDVPSEYAKARQSGHRTLTLDMPANDLFDASALADALSDAAPSVGRMTPYTTQNPDDAFRIESEQRSVWSGPLIRTRIENHEGREIVALDAPDAIRRDADASKRLRLRHLTWLQNLWRPALDGGIPTSKQIRDTAQRIELMREATRQQHPPQPAIAADYDADPERLRFLDEELHAPHEETILTHRAELMLVALARRVFARDIDDLLSEELGEITATVVRYHEDAGHPLPMLRHMRGHSNWAEAVASQIHIAEYVGSAEDILG